DALIPSPATESRAVDVNQPFDYPFAAGPDGTTLGRRELPTPIALFLVLRGEATLPPAPG
ncbi:MAG TPA: hypothetical protein VEY07_01805, partial [Thermoplasmata archaeon]|nr:hypothetical protein [Thermoplasmata archaeon]